MQKKFNVEVALPPVPSGLKVKLEVDPETSRTLVTKTLPLGEFTDSELRTVGKQWTDALLAEAAKQRNP